MSAEPSRKNLQNPTKKLAQPINSVLQLACPFQDALPLVMRDRFGVHLDRSWHKVDSLILIFLNAMHNSPEFWNIEAYRERKTIKCIFDTFDHIFYSLAKGA